MWDKNHDHASRSKFKKYGNKHRKEYLSCFANLDMFIGFLNMEIKPSLATFGFMHHEGGGLYAIAQTKVRSPKETRLYIYCNETTETVFILGIGDKDSQRNDIREAKGLVKTEKLSEE